MVILLLLFFQLLWGSEPKFANEIRCFSEVSKNAFAWESQESAQDSNEKRRFHIAKSLPANAPYIIFEEPVDALKYTIKIITSEGGSVYRFTDRGDKQVLYFDLSPEQKIKYTWYRAAEFGKPSQNLDGHSSSLLLKNEKPPITKTEKISDDDVRVALVSALIRRIHRTKSTYDRRNKNHIATYDTTENLPTRDYTQILSDCRKSLGDSPQMKEVVRAIDAELEKFKVQSPNSISPKGINQPNGADGGGTQ